MPQAQQRATAEAACRVPLRDAASVQAAAGTTAFGSEVTTSAAAHSLDGEHGELGKTFGVVGNDARTDPENASASALAEPPKQRKKSKSKPQVQRGPQWDHSVPYGCVRVDATAVDLLAAAGTASSALADGVDNAYGVQIFTSAEWEPLAAIGTEAAQAHFLYPLVVQNMPRGGVRRSMFSAWRLLETKLRYYNDLCNAVTEDADERRRRVEEELRRGTQRQKLRKIGRHAREKAAAAAAEAAAAGLGDEGSAASADASSAVAQEFPSYALGLGYEDCCALDRVDIVVEGAADTDEMLGFASL